MAHRIGKSLQYQCGKALLSILIVLALAIGAGVYYYLQSGPQTMTDVAKDELKAIRTGNISKAYQLTTSAFQQQTSLEVFNSFVGGYPILQQHTDASFTENTSGADKGVVTGILTSGDERKMQVDYEFVKEGANWRIQGMRVAPVADGANKMAADNTGMTIESINVSDEADGEGYVTKPKLVVDKLASKIYATVLVKAPKAGGKVEATITQMSNGAKIGPSVDEIGKAGNVLKAFAFTRVTNSWAEGDYEVSVKVSSGDTKALKFQVK